MTMGVPLGQRPGELPGVLVDLLDDAGLVLELVDHLLQLLCRAQRRSVTTTDGVKPPCRHCASCRLASRCASQAIEFDLPEPAECWTR